MANKTKEQIQAEELLNLAQLEHGFDPNAKVWCVNGYNVGYADNHGSKNNDVSEVLNFIKKLGLGSVDKPASDQ